MDSIYYFFRNLLSDFMLNPFIEPEYIFTQRGKKRALCIGINYIDLPSLQLSGCINDLEGITHFLKENCAFKADELVTLRDDIKESNPTRRRICNEIANLVEWANKHPGSSIWFSYAGHGTHVKDWSGDEADDCDECLVPVDITVSGVIADDQLHKMLIAPLNSDVKLFILVDACNSGTMFDLARDRDKQIYMISGCADDEQSMERLINGEVRGYLTSIFESTYSTFHTLITHHGNICNELEKNNVNQQPILTMTRDISGLYLSEYI